MEIILFCHQKLKMSGRMKLLLTLLLFTKMVKFIFYIELLVMDTFQFWGMQKVRMVSISKKDWMSRFMFQQNLLKNVVYTRHLKALRDLCPAEASVDGKTRE